MKIIIDKIEAHPPHAFSPPELREFIRLLPDELLCDVRTVRLSSAIEYSASIFVASFSRLERRLVIVSRGKTRLETMRAVIRCLVAQNHRRPSPHESEYAKLRPSDVERVAAQTLSAIEPSMPASPHWNRVELKYIYQTKTQTA